MSCHPRNLTTVIQILDIEKEELAMHHLSDSVTQARFQGALFVSRANKTMIDAGYGWADRRTSRPNTPETPFQIASISKQLAAGAILLLQEKGALSVHDPLERWLPECSQEWKSITVHHLLTHTSGIDHWGDLPHLSLYHPIARADLFAIFQQAPLKFAPGTAWAYSSPGYVLLAYIVEQIADEPYAQFVQSRILAPLSMTRSSVGTHSSQPEQQAVGYAGKKKRPSFELDTVSIGAGDVWTTARDLGLWNQALMTPDRLLTAESLTLMFTSHVSIPDAVSEIHDASYGYGWFRVEIGGHHVCFHPGDNSGFGALNLLVPAETLMIILLANDEDFDIWSLGQTLLDQALEET
jgi:CubicO group peptidase (beta-lactamase class C family)